MTRSEYVQTTRCHEKWEELRDWIQRSVGIRRTLEEEMPIPMAAARALGIAYGLKEVHISAVMKDGHVESVLWSS